MLRVTADTNVFISGLNFRGGKPFQVLELARERKKVMKNTTGGYFSVTPGA